ncbi:MAG: hypothetical protein CVV42_00485 [Candidatus Riflebacteria bacterium HGW-Riflebacteria-2]|jgi:hypothetical protein|nr:MAG: hypothetical protein CVV42_00485 [Candidatus Riflebacteria bacterium HGW-Riflebacteria-2]
MSSHSTTIPDAVFKRPGVVLLFVAVLIFATSLVISQWFAKKRSQIMQDWEAHERGQMAQIVQKVARFSAAETYYPFVLRQAAELLRKSDSEYAFDLLRPLIKKASFLFYSAAGKRIAVEGFPLEKTAVSEQVMARLMRPESMSENRSSSLSSAFFGRRKALATISRNPETLIELKGCRRFSHAGWWRLFPHAGDGISVSSQVANVLVLVETGRRAEENLLQEVFHSVRSSLPDYYHLALKRVSQKSFDSHSSGVAAESHQRHFPANLLQNGWLEEKAYIKNGLCVELRRKLKVEGYYRGLLDLWNLLTILAQCSFLLLTALVGRYLFVARRQEVSLRRVMSVAILLSMIPVLALFAQWCFDYLQTSTQNTVRQQHRVIERALEDIDLGLVQHNAAIAEVLNTLKSNLAGGSQPVTHNDLLLAKLGDMAEAVYLMDESGVVVEKFAEIPERRKTVREVATFLVTNVVAHLHNVAPKKADATFNLSYVRSFSHNTLKNLGRIIELNWAGYKRSMYLSFVRDAQKKYSTRFLVAFLDHERVFKDYLAVLSQKKSDVRLGIVEMSAGGPRSSMPDQLLLNSDLLMLSEEVWRLKRTVDRLINLPGIGRCLVTGIHARNMGDVVLLGATPFQPIAQSNHKIVSFTVMFVAFSFCTAILAALFISRNLGLSVRRLAKALEGIKNHEFDKLLKAETESEGRIFSGIKQAAHTFSEIYNAQPLRKKLVFEGSVAVGSIELESFFLPGRFLGSDYIEALPLPDNRLLFCIGEISGKPIPATLMGARIKMFISMAGAANSDPAKILLELNNFFMCERKYEQQISFLCLIANDDGSIDIANAGQHAPLLVTSSGVTSTADSSLLLGETQPPVISSHKIVLAAGSCLIFATSGGLKLFDRESVLRGREKLVSELVATPGLVNSSELKTLWLKLAGEDAAAQSSDEDRSLVVIRRTT